MGFLGLSFLATGKTDTRGKIVTRRWMPRQHTYGCRRTLRRLVTTQGGGAIEDVLRARAVRLMAEIKVLRGKGGFRKF